MPEADADLMLALADCRIRFPGDPGDGLTAGNLVKWQTDYAAARDSATAKVLITATQFEGGGSTQAQRQFDARHLARALLLRRAELDPDFDDLAFAPPAVKPRSQNPGFTIEFGPPSFIQAV